VHLTAELAHLWAFVLGREGEGFAGVEGFDFLGDPEVLVGDCPVGDAGVDPDLCRPRPLT